MKKLIPTLSILVALLLSACSSSTPTPVTPINFSGNYKGLLTVKELSTGRDSQGIQELFLVEDSSGEYDYVGIFEFASGKDLDMNCTKSDSDRTGLSCSGINIARLSPLKLEFLSLIGDLSGDTYSGNVYILPIESDSNTSNSDNPFSHEGTFSFSRN